MLKTLLTGAFLLLTLMACATVAPTPARDVARAASLAAAPRRDCVSDTATRIPVKADECVGFGQTYTQNDLERTGQRELGPALRMLDPSVTVHGR
ncbi:MAG: hypothetical protein E6K46_07075 [Gammaproteobacteria bacterium]|nr:MAG: hypothetical protein E6K46_07075 [Gammaproteobacteria bacterium]